MEEGKKTCLVVDVETTTRSPVGSPPTAFWPENRVVLVGIKDWRRDRHFITPRSCSIASIHPAFIGHSGLVEVTRLIGHNIKFDLHYLRRTGALVGFEKHPRVWDTQLAEYLLTGQRHRFASLDELTMKYTSLPVKDSEVTEVFKSGGKVEEIPTTKLGAYLIGDLDATNQIALAQMEEANTRGILHFIEAQMEALVATAEIEYNGIQVDLERMEVLKIAQESHVRTLAGRLRELMFHLCQRLYEKKGLEEVLTDIFSGDFNLDSTSMMSSFIFGGPYTVSRPYQHTYKNGKQVTRTHRTEYILPDIRSVLPRPSENFVAKHSTSKEVLESLILHIRDNAPPSGPYCISVMLDFLETYMEYKVSKKDLTTYFEGVPKQIFPDSRLHPQVHQCSTATGRLSSSNPNEQNFPDISKSKFKQTLVSRFEGGVIVEFDYKQLEVVALAILSRDPTLLKDLSKGVDIHEQVGLQLYGNKKEATNNRRLIKSVVFCAIYGGSATAAAKQAGIDRSLANKIITTFYNRYSTLEMWQRERMEEVESNRVPGEGFTKKGYPAGESLVESITGRCYSFNEYDAPHWVETTTSFSPTEVKNYFVQGFATGDIVPTMMGVIYRQLEKWDWLDSVKLIAQVHDSLYFDIDAGNLGVTTLSHCIDLIKEILESAPEVMQDIYGIDFPLPLPVSFKAGPSWGELK